jgi:AcrR family transcriptional regulator
MQTRTNRRPGSPEPGAEVLLGVGRAGEPGTRGERTVRAILDSARDLFISQGYHGTGIREVATAAGLTVGAVYNHFAGKQAIFERVFDEHNPFGLVPAALAEARGADIEEIVRDASVRLNHQLRQRRDLLRLVFIELLEFNGRHIPATIARNAEAVEKFLDRLREAGGVRLRPLPPLLLMRTFLGLLSAWFFTETLFEHELPASLAGLRIEDAVEVFLHGALLPGTGSTAPCTTE